MKIRILCSSCSQMHQRSFFSLFKTVINCYLNTIFPQTPSCCYLLVVSSLIRNHVISRMTSRCEALASHRIGLKNITASIFFPVCSLLHLLKGRYFSQRKEYQGCIWYIKRQEKTKLVFTQYRIQHKEIHSLSRWKSHQCSTSIQGITCCNNVPSRLKGILFRRLIFWCLRKMIT